MLRKKFDRKIGWYGWSGRHYFLFEYEQSLLSRTRQKKVDWSDLLTSNNDKISIEHIYPQSGDDNWSSQFDDYDEKWKNRYCGSLGNLLLLSMSVNSSLQNDSFNDKKNPKRDDNDLVIRSGYSNGSHSEIEVSQNDSWGPSEITARGLLLLNFMEERWRFRFPKNFAREILLHLEVDPKLDSSSNSCSDVKAA